MHNNHDYPLIMAILAIFKQLILISYNATNTILSTERSLSVKNMQNLRTSQVCKLHMNRICNICEYLFQNKKGTSAISKKQTFEPDLLVTIIARNFADAVSGYAEIHVSFTPKAATKPITVEKTKFELAVFNLLYCSLHGIKQKDTPLKLTLYITENKNETVFHIRDNSKSISQEIIDYVFLDKNIGFKPDSLFDSVVALSLNAAAKAAEDMGGNLTYTTLKTGNRYDIALPKANKSQNAYTANSIESYKPNYKYLSEILASIHAEELLKNQPRPGDEI